MVVYVFNCNLPVAEVVLKRPTKNECMICGLETAELVLCRNKHALCMLDFSETFQVEIGNHRQRFLSNGCKLFCPLCPRRDQDADFARKCASNLSDEVYGLYEGCITEAAVIAAQQECQLRFQGAPKPASQDPDKISIGKMMLSILHHHTPPYTTLHPPCFHSCGNSTHL